MTPFAIATALQSIRDELLPPDDVSKFNLLKILPDWRWEWYALLTLIAVIVVLFDASFRMARASQIELVNFREAWDRTGKYMIPIKEGLDIIISSLGNVRPKGTSQETLYNEAIAKLRGIGWSNPCHLTGHLFNSKTKMFQEFEIPIRPDFWNKHTLNLDAVLHGNGELPQTHLDLNWSFDIPKNDLDFGRIKINKSALISMFPQ